MPLFDFEAEPDFSAAYCLAQAVLRCKTCQADLGSLYPLERQRARPTFLICFGCRKVFQVGHGKVLEEGLIEAIIAEAQQQPGSS